MRVTFIPAALLIGVWFLLQLLGLVFGIVTARLFQDSQRIAGQE